MQGESKIPWLAPDMKYTFSHFMKSCKKVFLELKHVPNWWVTHNWFFGTSERYDIL